MVAKSVIILEASGYCKLGETTIYIEIEIRKYVHFDFVLSKSKVKWAQEIKKELRAGSLIYQLSYFGYSVQNICDLDTT